MTRVWAWAPCRRRRRRVQRKVDGRSGAQHYVPKGYRGLPESAPPDIRILTSRHRVVQAPSWGAAMAFSAMGHWRVASTMLGEAWVSTVFLRVRHGYGSHEMWFETRVASGGEREDYTRRYETWKEASEGHQKVVAMLQTDDRESLTTG